MDKNNDVIQKILGEPVRNLVHSFYDSFVEANVQARHQAGLQTVIIRRQLSKCCEWCANLAGIYDYDNAPRDVYKRHDNCKCMVTVEYGRGVYKDVWSKKEYRSQRQARLARLQEIEKDNNRLDEHTLLRRKAQSEGHSFFDSTDYWLNQQVEPGVVQKSDYFLYKGKRYYVDGSNVVFSHNQQEWDVAEIMANTFGGTVELLPAVNRPKHVRAADFSVNGIKHELKTPTGSSQRTIGNNIEEARGQATHVIIDISQSSIPEDLAIESMKRYFHVESGNFMEMGILIKDGKVLKILERT